VQSSKALLGYAFAGAEIDGLRRVKQGSNCCFFVVMILGRAFAALGLILTVNKIKTDILAGNREIKTMPISLMAHININKSVSEMARMSAGKR
jgi:hypothetical protein